MAKVRQYIVTIRGRGEVKVKVRALSETEAQNQARAQVAKGKAILVPTEENIQYDIHIRSTEEVK